MYKLESLLVILALAAGCKGRGQTEMAASFPIVTPPAMLEGYDARVEYSALHFWDLFADAERNYSRDTSLIGGVERAEVEQKFAEWVSYLGVIDFQAAVSSVENLYAKVSECESKDTLSNIFDNMNLLIQKYLYDPNSPYRNEDLYGIYAAKLSESVMLDDATKEIYAYDARMCAKNRVGTYAADFVFSDSRGKVRNLYGIKSEFTLLFFSNPGCEACKQIISVLTTDSGIHSLIVSGRLAVVNIYIDEDIYQWHEYVSLYPAEWYNGYDPNFVIRTDLLYNVRAIPSLYLLDADKKVILKDVPENRLFTVLGEMILKN